MIQNYDVLILGSGTAGQSLALRLADHLRIALVTKRSLADSASAWAQGGIAAVLDATDSVDDHIRDTFVAGAGLCDVDATRYVVEHGRQAIEWLIDRGVPFTREKDAPTGYHLTREGGHSHRRIIHAADATGAAIFNTLLHQAQAHANITLLENRVAIDLITSAKLGMPGNQCLGAYVLNRDSGHVETFGARFTVLATGGVSKVYLYTSNPDSASGMASPWPGAPVAGWPTWNSTSSTPPACTTPGPRVF